MEKDFSEVIKVLIVDDSPVICKVLNEMLNSDPRIIVTGIVSNGEDAVKYASILKPDIITMDINMPVMDGLQATKQIMAENPIPIIIVSSALVKDGVDRTFEAISYGALDVFDKSKIDIKSGMLLIEKIKQLKGTHVIRHPRPEFVRRSDDRIIELTNKIKLHRIIAIASSTGGPQALVQTLKNLPKNLPCSIVIVQHISDGFEEGLAEWLDNDCNIKVKVAENDEKMLEGTAYIAPCGFQMEVTKKERIFLSKRPSHNDFMPSGDILLESVAEIYKDSAIGIILTGMGSDGALGIRAIKKNNGFTIAQDEKSCVVFGMPKAAIELNVVDLVLPVEIISNNIIKILKRG